MTTPISISANTAFTFLPHFFGSGLSDDTWVVEQFRAAVTAASAATPTRLPRRRRVGVRRTTAFLLVPRAGARGDPAGDRQAARPQ